VSQFRLTSPHVKLTEKDVVKQCMDLLRLRGYYVVRLPAGDYRALDDDRRITIPAGLPDYVCLKHDFFLETKRPGGKLRPAQVKKHIELQANRIAVCTADSVEYLSQWLDTHEKSKAGNSTPGH